MTFLAEPLEAFSFHLLITSASEIIGRRDSRRCKKELYWKFLVGLSLIEIANKRGVWTSKKIAARKTILLLCKP